MYCQSLTGLGHYVRGREIARALAARHEVHLTTGGRVPPGEDDDDGAVRALELEPLRREDGRLVAHRDVGAVLAGRQAMLREAIRALRPDALLVEHFPFGKWGLADEALAAIGAARAARADVKVICSLRDIGLRSRYVDTDRRFDVGAALAAHFDALLVHGDPAVTRLDAQMPDLAVAVPVHYTGYVARRPSRPAPEVEGAWLVSAGGGLEADEVVGPCLAARRLLGGGRMIVVTGPFLPDAKYAALVERCASEGAEVVRFTPDLVDWMAAADVSISRAGYNTCANVLASGARAVLLPSPRMVDQELRARRLAELGLVEALAPGDADPGRIAEAVQRARARPAPVVGIDLDGTRTTCALVEKIVAG